MALRADTLIIFPQIQALIAEIDEFKRAWREFRQDWNEFAAA
jgi:hypothetical protein